MPNFSNKTVDYKVKATDENGALQLIDDSADVQLPSIERLTDTTKGSGILGEIDWPSYALASMVTVINTKANNPKHAILLRPGEIKAEISWVLDKYESGAAVAKRQQNKVFITGFNKKFDLGKLEVGATSDGSVELETVYLRWIVDGVEVLLIDKFNYKFVINGKDYLAEIRAALE